MITEFNKAMILSKSCDDKLKSAEEAITKLVKDNNEIVEAKNELINLYLLIKPKKVDDVHK